MTFVAEFSKAAEAVSGLSVVDEPITHPYLQALAQSLRTLASLGEPLLISPAGTTGTIAKFTSPSTIGNSVITEVAGKIIIGADPGGGEILRVGGNVRIALAGGTALIITDPEAGGVQSLFFGDTVALLFRTQSNHPIKFGTNNSDRMTLTASGELVVGVDPGGAQLLRVGGTGTFGGLVTVVAEKNAQVKWSNLTPSGVPPDGTIWIQY